MPEKSSKSTTNKPGVKIHPKVEPSSGGLADWGPLLAWATGGIKRLWKKLKK
ncbi:MAG TPA: hypothetical protein H9875_05035 [Candidatus Levilactobacillus faecigallinarum]|uniref:Uncharacterized protein n=1 Tax=Candidatus Levilactobacillus faecigallinarum TaxID=2838638 RepID=A0A9D1QU27_9LACO|nr:hypothetical protein [Candidatus Levilactobacillus faecigallinarum]